MQTVGHYLVALKVQYAFLFCLECALALPVIGVASFKATGILVYGSGSAVKSHVMVFSKLCLLREAGFGESREREGRGIEGFMLFL
jgi:hypothetical protein